MAVYKTAVKKKEITADMITKKGFEARKPVKSAHLESKSKNYHDRSYPGIKMCFYLFLVVCSVIHCFIRRSGERQCFFPWTKSNCAREKKKSEKVCVKNQSAHENGEIIPVELNFFPVINFEKCARRRSKMCAKKLHRSREIILLCSISDLVANNILSLR